MFPKRGSVAIRQLINDCKRKSTYVFDHWHWLAALAGCTGWLHIGWLHWLAALAGWLANLWRKLKSYYKLWRELKS